MFFIDKDGRTGEHCFYEKTDVSMYTLTEDEIDRYISSGDPMDKAGSYGYRDALPSTLREYMVITIMW